MTEFDLNLQIAIETLDKILKERNDIYLNKAVIQLEKMLDESANLQLSEDPDDMELPF